MNKTLFSQPLNDITSYNKINIDSTNLPVIKINEFSDSTFTIFSSQTEILISSSGRYTIKNIDNSSKNIKILISSNINVEIIEINNSNDHHTINQMNIVVSNDSTCTYFIIDDLNTLYTNRIANLEANATLNFKVLSLNSKLSENKFSINLNGEHSNCNFQSVSVATIKNENSYDVTINNHAKYTNAKIWQKGVSSNLGKINFVATGHIKKGCDKATNFQESRILLLDEAALGNVSPILLIDHFDVEAGHGASVSRVNDEELFYLQSRGIETSMAEQLMTHAFINPLFDSIEDEEIRNLFLNSVNKRLENA